MPLTPKDWSVVVVGRWNRAILTPAGIGKRIFKLSEGTPLEVLVAIDAIAPPRVKFGTMIVVAGSDRLFVQPAINSFSELANACSLACNAIVDLPETPLTASGFNVRYSIDGYFGPIDDVLMSDLDDRASDMRFEILERQLHRSVRWSDGKINIVASLADDGTRTLALNFDLQSDDRDDHLKWLSQGRERVANEVERVIRELFKIEREDIEYESQTVINDDTPAGSE